MYLQWNGISVPLPHISAGKFLRSDRWRPERTAAGDRERRGQQHPGVLQQILDPYLLQRRVRLRTVQNVLRVSEPLEPELRSAGLVEGYS